MKKQCGFKAPEKRKNGALLLMGGGKMQQNQRKAGRWMVMVPLQGV